VVAAAVPVGGLALWDLLFLFFLKIRANGALGTFLPRGLDVALSKEFFADQILSSAFC
jgi:hypothetical protein